MFRLLATALLSQSAVLPAHGVDEDKVCRGLDGAPQECENFTYVGSLVQDLPPHLALEDVLDIWKEVQAMPAPVARLSGCSGTIRTWFGHIVEYYETNKFQALLLLPTLNHVMQNYDQFSNECPVAWLATLLLKLESNLDRGVQGHTCARVHAAGCLRDARGYWGAYAAARSALPSESDSKAEEEPGESVAEVLAQGEARVISRFQKAFTVDGGSRDDARRSEEL